MLIFEDIECPVCSDKIKVIVENNVITSHGVCPSCDNTFSAERLQFSEDCHAMEDEFMASRFLDDDVLFEVDTELADFYNQLLMKGVEI
jgi:C4-type Zn-finger protein